MNTSKIFILILILGLLGYAGVYAEQSVQLEPEEGYYQFPFFDTKTRPGPITA